MGVIYKLAFPNGKVYIGMTINTLKQRMQGHRCAAKRPNPKYLLYKAWQVHGEPQAEVLFEVPDHDLARVEVGLIALYESYGLGGYNSTPGGEDSPMKRPEIVAKVKALASTPERIARTREVHIGSKRSPETLKLFSDMRKGQGKGIPKSPEHRRKISEANKGKKPTPHTAEARLKMSQASRRYWDARGSK